MPFLPFADYVQPVCLPYGDGLKYNFEGKDTIVAGWGLTGNYRMPRTEVVKYVCNVRIKGGELSVRITFLIGIIGTHLMSCCYYLGR